MEARRGRFEQVDTRGCHARRGHTDRSLLRNGDVAWLLMWEGPLSLEAHDALAKMCIGRLSAVPLPVCRCVSVDQLRLPDMDVSKVRAGRTRGSIKVPCDFVLRRFSVSHSVQRLLALQQASDVCAASLRRCAKRGFQQSTELRVIPEKAREQRGSGEGCEYRAEATAAFSEHHSRCMCQYMRLVERVVDD